MLEWHSLTPPTTSLARVALCATCTRFARPGPIPSGNRLPWFPWSTSAKTTWSSVPCGRSRSRLLATLEEHLLICQSCRDRLQATDEYVVAMKLAAAKIRESEIGD